MRSCCPLFKVCKFVFLRFQFIFLCLFSACSIFASLHLSSVLLSCPLGFAFVVALLSHPFFSPSFTIFSFIQCFFTSIFAPHDCPSSLFHALLPNDFSILHHQYHPAVPILASFLNSSTPFLTIFVFLLLSLIIFVS